ncbi:MAG: hypothetical protein AAGC77_10585 [Pseudomonadota bacterium]
MLDTNSSRPWYLGWRGVAAIVAALIFLIALIPSKEKSAAKRAERVFDYCLEQNRDDGEEPTKYERSACECVQGIAEERILDGAKTEDFEGAWYMTGLLYCTQNNAALLRDFEEASQKSESQLQELEQQGLLKTDKQEPSATQSDKRNQQQESSNDRSGKKPKKISRKHLDAFARIQQGDYVWTRTFPEDELVLFGFGLALRQAIDEQCPGAINTKQAIDIEYFLGGFNGAEVIDVIQGRKPLNLAAIMSRAAIDQTLLSAARRRFGELAEAKGCNSRDVRNTSTNLARMLAGRRPAHGAKATRTSLVTEKISPLEPKHAYDNERPAALTSRGAAQLDKDFREVRAGGLTILECHYDENPKDEWYEVQYYWGVSALANFGFLIPQFGEGFQRAAHERLKKANGRAYTHPFTTYGSPRLECPAFKDPYFDQKRIYAPRKPAPAGSNNIPTPKDPKITEKRAFVKYEYGPAPEDFVPPIPKNLPKNTLYLTMEKQGAGALKEIEVHPFGPWTLTREYAIGSPKQDLLQEDLIAVSKQKPRVIVCKYLAERRGVVSVSRHWFKRSPDGVNPDRLKGRISDHPMLVIDGARKTCAPSYAEAVR